MEETRGSCPICRGERWVCVDHPSLPWGGAELVEGCQCGAEGMACVCNPERLMPPGVNVIAEVDEPPKRPN